MATVTVTLYERNDTQVKLSDLQVQDESTYVNDATVTCNVYDASGVLVVGPITLSYTASSNGEYKGTIREGGSPGTNIIAGGIYTVDVDIVDLTNNIVSNFTSKVKAIKRPFS